MLRRPFAAALLLASAAFLPVAANAAPGFVDGSTELHAGPDYDYPTVAVIEDGEDVEVFGCLEDWSWCDVGAYDNRGWIAGDHLASVYEGRRQPIAYVAPYIGLGVLAFSFDTYWDNHYHGRPWYRERVRWHDYSRDHHRGSWDGRRGGGWAGNRGGDHRDWHGDNRRDNDRDRHNAGDRRPDHAGGDKNRGNTSAWSTYRDGKRDWDRGGDRGGREQPRQNNVQQNAQQQVPANPAGHMRENPAGRTQGRGGPERVERAQAPIPQAQPQNQGGAENRGGGERHGGWNGYRGAGGGGNPGGDGGGNRGGGDRGGDHGGGRGRD
jgi:uncharacterized protein YraI